MNLNTNTFREVGKIHTVTQNLKKEGAGSIITKRFLDSMVLGFARNSAKYINTLNEAPFIFKEKQLNSLIAPVLSQTSDAFLTEHPMLRKNPSIKKLREQKLSYLGWVDYWARKKDYDFYIEIKHDYDSFNTNTIRKIVRENWKSMNSQQLKQIKNNALYLSSNMKGVFLISLHVIVIYHYSKFYDEEWSGYDTSELMSIQKRYFSSIQKPNPNWSALWTLHDDLVKNCTWENETHQENYPGVLFLSRVTRIK